MSSPNEKLRAARAHRAMRNKPRPTGRRRRHRRRAKARRALRIARQADREEFVRLLVREVVAALGFRPPPNDRNG